MIDSVHYKSSCCINCFTSSYHCMQEDHAPSSAARQGHDGVYSCRQTQYGGVPLLAVIDNMTTQAVIVSLE